MLKTMCSPCHYINPSGMKYILENIKYIFVIYIISHNWDSAGTWNLTLWKTNTYWSYVVNTMAADELAIQEARASKTVVLKCSFQNILFSVPEGFI